MCPENMRRSGNEECNALVGYYKKAVNVVESCAELQGLELGACLRDNTVVESLLLMKGFW